MTLLEIRQQFVKLSGRMDLIGEGATDNGADFYIKAGQRYLDKHHTYEESRRRRNMPLETNIHMIEVSGVRSVREVWAIRNGRHIEIAKKDLDVLRKRYGDFSKLTPGFVPIYYAIDPARVEMMTKIYLIPPVDTAMDIEIKGLFYAPTLNDAGDSNFWSTEFPNVLVVAALRELEIGYRNTQGMKDWEAAIALEMQAFDMELAEREATHRDQMRG